jgi:hypothetical protein
MAAEIRVDQMSPTASTSAAFRPSSTDAKPELVNNQSVLNFCFHQLTVFSG